MFVTEIRLRWKEFLFALLFWIVPKTIQAKVKLRHDLQNSSKASKLSANSLVKQLTTGRLATAQSTVNRLKRSWLRTRLVSIGASTMFGIGFVVDFYQSKNEGDWKLLLHLVRIDTYKILKSSVNINQNISFRLIFNQILWIFQH